MSVVDQLKAIFVKKAPEMEEDSRLSLGMPDGAMDPLSMEQMTGYAGLPVGDRVNEPESELVSLPLLGKKTVLQHQRVLSILLGVSLVLLAGVTLFTLSQGDRVAQQIEATGNSLMQSQRLAKSVSQA
jgi:twitching motility protein PilJ